MGNACVYVLKYLLLLANPVKRSLVSFKVLLFRAGKCTVECTQSVMLMEFCTCGPRHFGTCGVVTCN